MGASRGSVYQSTALIGKARPEGDRAGTTPGWEESLRMCRQADRIYHRIYRRQPHSRKRRIAERGAANDRAATGREFGLRLGSVDAFDPVGRQRHESALICRAGPLGRMVSVPATHVCHRQPWCPFTQRSIAARPDDEMPMVRQEREADQPHLRSFPCLTNHLLECRIIGPHVKQRRTPRRPIEPMVDISGIRASHASRHANTIPKGIITVKDV